MLFGVFPTSARTAFGLRKQEIFHNWAMGLSRREIIYLVIGACTDQVPRINLTCEVFHPLQSLKLPKNQ
jgi:hypothetical protein